MLASFSRLIVATSIVLSTAQAHVLPRNQTADSSSESLDRRALSLESSSNQACPGYSFGIIDAAFQTGLGGEGYAIVDNKCNQMIGMVTPNPCIEKIFACSPSPIKLTHLYYHGKDMACDENDKMGNCRGLPVQFCCGKESTSNDDSSDLKDSQEDSNTS
ncbi:hypothetical protein K435DRAFT_300718 [Dendrothele bispora CBS 962.96]|uniref:Hydrophobin n=1 Tax=Dendrothele bispora (strain CBS 962.96) TaxID=1314807 RepID=A0A4S8LJ14_DENBC|nr:hypothetical protein K435DRAFT_300718 [Dendrothele bispora CBS 962.96]